jgi:hypothetical protein
LLESWLQEEVLDVIDSIASVSSRSNAGMHMHDFTREHGGRLFYVFLVATVLRKKKLLRISRVGTFSRPL